jgi:hypothetical protein
MERFWCSEQLLDKTPSSLIIKTEGRKATSFPWYGVIIFMGKCLIGSV